MGILPKYISLQGLKNLDAHYKYSGTDLSWCGKKFLYHVWDFGISITPRWVAPNLITFIGLLCNYLYYAITVYYNPHITGEMPTWVYYFCAFGIFFYQTMDNMDGKQARRTGSSSALGELFDHGCDALSVAIFSLTISAVTKAPLWMTFSSIFLGVIAFYIAHWEDYFSGYLILPEFTGPTEMQIGFVFVCCLSGVFGADIFNQVGPFGITLQHVMIAMTAYGTISTFQDSVRKMHRIRMEKHIGVWDVLYPLGPIAITVFFGLAWGLARWDMVAANPHLFLFTIELIFAYSVTRLIIRRVCEEKPYGYYYVQVPFILFSLNGVIEHFVPTWRVLPSQLACLWIMFFIALFNHLCMCVSVCDQLATHLKIRTFKIVPKEPAPVVRK